MPFTEKEMDNIDASIGIPGWCYHNTPAKPVIDRQSLEKALTHYDTAAAGASHKDRLYAPEMLTIMAAARLHLATLPKPVWRVTATLPREGWPAAPYDAHSHKEALDFARSYLEQGMRLVTVTQVSP